MMQINFKNFGMNMSFLFTMPANCLRACITVPKMRSCPYKTCFLCKVRRRLCSADRASFLF